MGYLLEIVLALKWSSLCMQLKSLSDCMSVLAAIAAVVVGGEDLVSVLLPSHAALQHMLWDVSTGEQEGNAAAVKVGSSIPLLYLKMNTV